MGVRGDTGSRSIHPPLSNADIARILEEVGLRYEMAGVPFKPRAYARAAASVRSLSESVCERYKREGLESLEELPGVGASIASHIASLCEQGTFPEHEELARRFPVAVRELTAIEGLGPRRVRQLYEYCGVRTLADLQRVLAKSPEKLASLPGWGVKAVMRLRDALALALRASERQPLGFVLPIAERIVSLLEQVRGVQQVAIAGSLRRRRDTVGDIDILVSTDDPARVNEVVVSLPEVVHVHQRGSARTSVRLSCGLDMDVRFIEENRWGAALLYFTGSRAHNIHLRTLAERAGYKLNEYGLFLGRRCVASRTEEEIYLALGLEPIPPELREDTGEIEAAAEGSLPELIPYDTLRGDCQVHSRWTDGSESIEAMARAAYSRGLEYFVLTDHTRTLAMTGGLDEQGLARQAQEVRKVNRQLARQGVAFRVIHGAEVNLMRDGSLDVRDAALAKLECVGVGVHSHFSLPQHEQTERLLRAIYHPFVDVIFHLTARIIGRRDPIALDIPRILDACAETGTALDIDAFPDRTDVYDTIIREGIKRGVRFVISTDAHAPPHLDYRNLGVAQARRGWATARDVLNTQSASAFLASLKRASRLRPR